MADTRPEAPIARRPDDRGADRPRVPILLYHSLSDDATASYRPWAVPPREFERQMEFLAEHGFSSLTVGEYVAALWGTAPLPAKPVVITFDDGFADLRSVALPVLERLGFRATAYLVSDGIGGRSRWLERDGEATRPLLSAAEVRDVAARGIEIGSHSRTHPELDTLPHARAIEEIRGSRDAIEQVLGAPVTTFAYPHGYHSRALKKIVRDGGFTSACGVKHALSHAGDDRWALGRVIVYSGTPLDRFATWVRGGDLPLSWRRERVRTAIWRTWRRAGRVWRIPGRPETARRAGG